MSYDPPKCETCGNAMCCCVDPRDAEIARLTAEVARMTAERDTYRERLDKWHNECLYQISCNCGLRTLIRSAKEHSAVCADIVSSSRAAKTMAVASDVNTPRCATEPSPGSACETGTSAQPTPEQDGPTTTRPGVSDGATVYVVMAHRGGDVENHTYCAAACSSLSQAKTSADEHEQYRGGKYACSILEVPVGMFNENASDFVEVRKVTPLPGWKTALQRVLDDRERDRRAETAERELAALRAAVRWLLRCWATDPQNTEQSGLDYASEHTGYGEHAEALRRATA